MILSRVLFGCGSAIRCVSGDARAAARRAAVAVRRGRLGMMWRTQGSLVAESRRVTGTRHAVRRGSLSLPQLRVANWPTPRRASRATSMSSSTRWRPRRSSSSTRRSARRSSSRSRGSTRTRPRWRSARPSATASASRRGAAARRRAAAARDPHTRDATRRAASRDDQDGRSKRGGGGRGQEERQDGGGLRGGGGEEEDGGRRKEEGGFLSSGF